MARDEQAIVRRPTPVVTNLLLLNALVFFFTTTTAPEFALEYFALWPVINVDDPALTPGWASFYPWQLVTYAFLHGGVFHLAINMFVLWMFGKPIEGQWGSGMFLAFYFFCVIGAALVQLLMTMVGLVPPAPAVGASGAVFAVLLVFGLMYPNQIVILIFPPIPMKAKYFVIFIGVLELFAGVFGTAPGIANFAHLAGMGFALLFILMFRRRLTFPPR